MGPDYGRKMRIKEIREAAPPTTSCRLNFWTESIDFSNLTFSPKEPSCIRAQNQSAALAPGLKNSAAKHAEANHRQP